MLPDPSTSFEKHLELVKAYVVLSKVARKALTYKSFQRLVDLSPIIISSNNAFLKEIGIIKEVEKQRGAYVPTETAIRLNNALKWQKEPEIQSILSDLLKNLYGFKKRILPNSCLELKGKGIKT